MTESVHACGSYTKLYKMAHVDATYALLPEEAKATQMQDYTTHSFSGSVSASSETKDILTSLPPLPPPPKRGILRQSSRKESISSTVSTTSNEPLLSPSTKTSECPEFDANVPGTPPPKLALGKQVSITLPEREENLEQEGERELISSTVAATVLGTSTGSTMNENDALQLTEELSEEESPCLQEPNTHRPPPPHKRRLRRLQSTVNFHELVRNELELKANLYFHISNPLKRWKVEKRIPMKLLLQLLKTCVLIIQVALFTQTIPYQRSDFFFESREVFESLFIRHHIYNCKRIPRSTYRSFTIEDVMEDVTYVITRYRQLPNITIGGYDFVLDANDNPLPIGVRLKQYRVAELEPSHSTYTLDGRIDEIEFTVSFEQNMRAIQEFFDDRLFHRFVEMVLSIPLKNIRIVHPERAECFLFNVKIVFNSFENSGEIRYFLEPSYEKQHCNATVLTPGDSLHIMTGFLTALDVIVLMLCFMSIYLTFATLYRALKLGRAMGTFYHTQLNVSLSWWERRSLFSFYHLINFISDLLIIFGTLYKILLDYNAVIEASPTRILLGTALVFQALVILRYVSYFKQLNALTRTLTLAFPELLKFLLCAFILFIAFGLCGWIVLGPFHEKFADLNGSIEALFGLLNGDDIYATFIEITPRDNLLAYIYSRIFLYVFLALFIYAVLNLFTSLIIVAYDVSQGKDTAIQNEVRRFVFSGPLTRCGVALRDFGITKKYVDPEIIKSRGRSDGEESVFDDI